MTDFSSTMTGGVYEILTASSNRHERTQTDTRISPVQLTEPAMKTPHQLSQQHLESRGFMQRGRARLPIC